MQEALEAGVVEPSAAPSTLGTENGTSDPALLSVNQAPTPDGLPSPAGLSLQQSAPETAAATPDVIGDLEPLTMEVDAPDGVGTVTLDMSTIGAFNSRHGTRSIANEINFCRSRWYQFRER